MNCLTFLSNKVENCVQNDDEYSSSVFSNFGNLSKTEGNITSVSFRPIINHDKKIE